ncbi:MAG: HD domain-containing phosphohydrolase [bacterium]
MNKVLFLDDDQNILSGIMRLFRGKYDIYTATSGQDALVIVKTKGPFAVAVSDYRMPEMDGNKFFTNLKSISPDTVRIMLTGYADVDAAIEAINEGNIFRFLTKPCDNDRLNKAIIDGLEQYRLIISEKELFQLTLRGTIKLLIEILDLTNPYAFSKAVRLRNIVRKLSKSFSDDLILKVELAALLSQIGLISLPPDILEKIEHSKTLTLAENKLYTSHPEVGEALLKNIPRLETVAEAISYQLKRLNPEQFQNNDGGENETYVIAKILKKALDLDHFLEGKRKEEEAIQQLELKKEETKKEKFNQEYLRINELKPGMTIDLNVVDKGGVILIGKGQEITQVIKLRLQGYLELGRIHNLVKIKV